MSDRNLTSQLWQEQVVTVHTFVDLISIHVYGSLRKTLGNYWIINKYSRTGLIPRIWNIFNQAEGYVGSIKHKKANVNWWFAQANKKPNTRYPFNISVLSLGNSVHVKKCQTHLQNSDGDFSEVNAHKKM